MDSAPSECDDCNTCGAPAAATVCARCHIARYCSAGCQADDWDHDDSPHSAWCFDRADPDIDHLKRVIAACALRNEQERDDGDDVDGFIGGHARGIREDSEESEESDDLVDPDVDISDAIEWLEAELEDPFLHVGADAFGEFQKFKANRRLKRAKKKKRKGRFKKRTAVGGTKRKDAGRRMEAEGRAGERRARLDKARAKERAKTRKFKRKARKRRRRDKRRGRRDKRRTRRVRRRM